MEGNRNGGVGGGIRTEEKSFFRRVGVWRYRHLPVNPLQPPTTLEGFYQYNSFTTFWTSRTLLTLVSLVLSPGPPRLHQSYPHFTLLTSILLGRGQVKFVWVCGGVHYDKSLDPGVRISVGEVSCFKTHEVLPQV